MVKTITILSAALLVLSGCSKELETPPEQMNLDPISSNAVNATPINQRVTFPLETYIYNACNDEYVYIKGTVHYKVSGMVSENKITYVLHYNYSGVTGLGLSSGKKYVAGGSFNYSNTDSFDGNLVYQQNSSFNFISVAGGDSFKIINDWHLTINANGVATFFFTTGGDVLTCI